VSAQEVGTTSQAWSVKLLRFIEILFNNRKKIRMKKNQSESRRRASGLKK